jgi:hypothetical protein
MRGYSLQDIIDNAGCLPENIIQCIALQLIDGMEEYNTYFSEDYGELCTCDILFDKYGKLKVR